MVYNSTDAEFSKMELTIVNNPELQKVMDDRKTKIHSREAAQNEIKDAKPDITQEKLDKLTPLQEELNRLDGNKSQPAKKRRAALIKEMNAIEDGVSTEKVEIEVTTEEARKSLELDNELSRKAQERGDPGPETVLLSKANIEERR